MAATAEASLLDYEMSMKTMQLEKEYEKAIADSTRLLDAEKDRMQRMEQLLLKFESESLRAQLDEANEQLLGLTQVESEACLQLDEAYQEIDRLDRHVQSSFSEIQKLRSELTTLRNSSTGYNTLATEKSHMSREISELRSELERLRTQNLSLQVGSTDKHGMERQLNSLEVQLGNERHAHERTRAKGAQQADTITNLSSRIEELQSELAKESRVAQQHERERRQQNTEWDTQRTVLEGKIETLRKQLRSTKDKLQGAQDELQHKRNNVRNSEGDVTEPRSRVVPLQRPGPNADYHSGVTIATPGAVRMQDKAKRQSALPGDKSAFSITPFLNRTGIPTDSPLSSEAGEDDMDVTMDESRLPLHKAHAVDEAGGLEATPKDVPGPIRSAPAKGAKAKPKARDVKTTISKPAHEVRKSSKPVNVQTSPQPSDESRDPFVEQAQAKPKKRKLGVQRDRSLFDEDEEEDDLAESRRPGRKLGPGAGRNSVLATALPAASAGERLPRALGLGASMAFSPLKRDRKRL